jgi:hypothetical protein
MLLYRLPEDIGRGGDMAMLRAELTEYARLRETQEQRQGGERSRTHYKATLSFERPVEKSVALTLVQKWLEECFPLARGAAFLHSNSGYLHAHVWLDARQTEGRKLHLSWQQYRRLDEAWNRLYCLALGRDEREHLVKKQETREYRQRSQEDRSVERPPRAAHRWRMETFTQRERTRLETGHEPHQSRTRSHQPQTPRRRQTLERREPHAARGEPATPSISGFRREAAQAADTAVREADRLRQTLARLVDYKRERGLMQERDEDRER